MRKKTDLSEPPAIEQIQAFGAAANFPKDIMGVRALADALHQAAADTGMTMKAIVRDCTETSPWCPTPFDIRGMALAMRDKIRRAKAEGKHSSWERIYGPPEPDWSRNLIGALVGATPAEHKRLTHERAIRDMLFYTEGDGREQGDRDFWKDAREHDLDHCAEMVDQVRAAGGWQTERELQGQQQASTAGSGDA